MYSNYHNKILLHIITAYMNNNNNYIYDNHYITTIYNSPQRSMHSLRVPNWFLFPWQPPYMNNSHWLELVLKNQRGNLPLHEPTSGGRWQVAR